MTIKQDMFNFLLQKYLLGRTNRNEERELLDLILKDLNTFIVLIEKYKQFRDRVLEVKKWN